MDAGATIRALRWRMRLSQREFARAVGIPRSTLQRIEAGRCDPLFRTMARIAEVVGCELVLLDRSRNEIAPDRVREGYFDRAGRHFPAHLVAGRTPGYMEVPPPDREWWGWHHIAFPPLDHARKPENTYWRRLKPWPEMWDDAT